MTLKYIYCAIASSLLGFIVGLSIQPKPRQIEPTTLKIDWQNGTASTAWKGFETGPVIKSVNQVILYTTNGEVLVIRPMTSNVLVEGTKK